MFHPFQGNLEELSDADLETKIKDLSKKYLSAQRQNNPYILTQLQTFITIYREELTTRSLKKKTGNDDDSLDQLINVE